MATILDLPGVRARVAPMSVELYEVLTEQGRLEKRTELIRGIIVKKMSKPPLHRKLTKLVYDDCQTKRPSDHVIFQEAPLRLMDSVPEPDVMVVRGKQSDFDARHPTKAELVIEVAMSSVELDRENAILYAEAGVPEYWIVLGNERQVEVYRQLENGVYRQRQLYSAEETLACTSVPDLQVALAEWFV